MLHVSDCRLPLASLRLPPVRSGEWRSPEGPPPRASHLPRGSATLPDRPASSAQDRARWPRQSGQIEKPTAALVPPRRLESREAGSSSARAKKPSAANASMIVAGSPSSRPSRRDLFARAFISARSFTAFRKQPFRPGTLPAVPGRSAREPARWPGASFRPPLADRQDPTRRAIAAPISSSPLRHLQRLREWPKPSTRVLECGDGRHQRRVRGERDDVIARPG